jgi:hypothetical protein
MADLAATQTAIAEECAAIKRMLLEKNAAYGNSAIEPIGIFAKESAIAQIRVRIDDKLKRIQNGTEYPGDDTVFDLIGYLVLYRVAKRLENGVTNG